MKIKDVTENSKLPKIETELLIAHVLKADKSFVFSYPEKELTKNQEKQIDNFIQRRSNNEPLAYIIGKKEFYGLEFFVDKRVLIPRPETEELVRIVIASAGRGLDPSRNDGKLTVVDVGTGSGCIAIAIAKNLPEAKVYAIDTSEKSLEVAKENALKHQVQDQIELLKGHLLEPLPVNLQVDFILANLPYIPTQNYFKLARQIKDFEPKVALDSGEKATALYEKLFEQSKPLLENEAKLFYELDGEILEFI